MGNTPFVVIANTSYHGENAVSDNRVTQQLQLLKNTKDLGIPVVLGDRSSTHQRFLDSVKAFENVTFFSSNFPNYPEQIAQTLACAQKLFPDEATGFLRLEEKPDFIRRDIFEDAKSAFDLNDSLQMIAATRDRSSLQTMPDFQRETESKIASSVNKKLESTIGKGNILESYMLGGTYTPSEGPASFFGPIFLTQQGVQTIIDGCSEASDENAVFFRKKIELLLQSHLENPKVGFLETSFTYNYERDVHTENQDTQSLLHAFGFMYNKVGIEDFIAKYLNSDISILNTQKFRDFTIQHPNNLAFKRVRQYYEIGGAMFDSIAKKSGT